MKTMFWLNGPLEFLDEEDRVMETVDVFWFIDHYESYCRENGLKINERRDMASSGAARAPAGRGRPAGAVCRDKRRAVASRRKAPWGFSRTIVPMGYR